VQGLSRYEDETGVETDYIVVKAAKQVLGEDWIDGFIERAQQVELRRYCCSDWASLIELRRSFQCLNCLVCYSKICNPHYHLT